MEPWNDASLLPPPSNTCRCDNIDLEDLLYTFGQINIILTKQTPLHNESAILSRFIYKFDKKFRNDIGYRNFKKVNTALRKYLTLNLLKDVENFVSMLPLNDSSELFFPTRQMLEYILVRLQTFSKIILRICVCSKQAAVFYLDRVKRGESHWMSLMPYAVLCRVWSLSSVLIQHVCSWYYQLYKLLDKLKPVGMPFLPPTYILPKNLKDWLDIKNLDEYGRFEWSRNKHIEVTSFLNEVDETDAFDIYKYVENINCDTNETNENEFRDNIDSHQLGPKSVGKSDYGETMSRETFKKIDPGEMISRETFKKTDPGETISRETFKQIDPGETVSREKFKKIDPGHSISRETFKKIEPGETVSRETFKKIDPGETISSHTFKEIFRSTKNMVKLKAHSADNVTGNDTLQKFLDDEEKYRNEGSDHALTKHLSFMQWQALKSNLLKLCNPLSKRRKIERKFQKIWKEKCLDYQ